MLASKAVKDIPEIKKPSVKSTKKGLLFTDKGIESLLLSDSSTDSYEAKFEIPDLLTYIQSKTELTRSTILEILKKSERLNEYILNPQLFMDYAVTAIRTQLYELMIDGIKYEKIGDKWYEMIQRRARPSCGILSG